MARANQARQMHKRKCLIALTAIAGVCCLCMIVFGMQKPQRMPEPQNFVQTINREPRLGFAIRCSAAEAKPAELIKDVITPCEMLLRVRDVTGMDETERNDVSDEEKRFAREIFENWDERTSNTIIQWGSETAVISMIYAGELELMIDNYDEVESKSVTATEMGLTSLGYVDSYEGDDKISIFLGLSDAAIEMIENDPGIALSTFSHSLTVTVEFKDGTTETAVIDIIIDDEGYMYAQQKSIMVTA